MDIKILEELGFTPKEAEIYIIMLGMKKSSVFEIMAKSKVSRQTIHEILQKLLDKGLISYIIKNHKKQYYATNPERMFDVIKEKEIILKEKQAKFEMLLPNLLKRYRKRKEDSSFEIFVGKEGMKTVNNNLLKVGKTAYILSNEGTIFDFLRYYMPSFMKKRAKLNIPIKIVFGECVRKKKLKIPLADIKYISDKYNSPMSLALYGECINIMIFSIDNPMAIYIKSKEISDSFMNYFNIMWKMAKE